MIDFIHLLSIIYVKRIYVNEKKSHYSCLYRFKHQMGLYAFMHDNINRADILVRMLAIDDFYNKNDFGFNLYTEMQHARSRTNQFIPKHQIDYKDKFCDLMTSFENGHNTDRPIILNKNK